MTGSEDGKREQSASPRGRSELDRRDLLRLAGTGALGGAVLSVPGGANQTGGEELSLTAEVIDGATVAQGGRFEVELTATNRAPTPQQLRVHYRGMPPCCYFQGICTISDIRADPPARIVSRSDDGGVWERLLTPGWLWDSVGPTETVSPRLIFEVPEDQATGDYTLDFEGQLGSCPDPNEEGSSEPQYATDTVDITVERSSPEYELSATASTDRVAPGDTVRITPTLENVGTASGTPSVAFEPASDDTAHNADYYQDEFDVVGHDDDGGNWRVEYWEWTDVGPDSTRQPTLELAVREPASAGKYTFSIVVRNKNGEREDRATVTITVTEDTAVSVEPTSIEFGAHVVGSTPTADFAVTNDSDETVELTADQAAGIEFVDDWWILPQFDAAEPPVTLAAGETTTFTIELDTATAFDNLGSAAELFIEFSADGEAPLELPVEATLLNEPAVFEELAETADRTRDMFDHEKIRSNAYDSLVAAYKNLADTTKELGIGSTDYVDALESLDKFVENIQSIGEYSAIERALEFSDDGLNGGTSEDFDSNYANYEEIASKLQTITEELRSDDPDTQLMQEAFREAKFTAVQLSVDWHGSRQSINKEQFRDALNNRLKPDQADTVVREYSKAVDEVANVVSLTTPMLVCTASPVKTTVTDPEGRTISSNQAEIPGASYRTINLDGVDGSKELIVIEDRQPGPYQIELEPEAGASADETYSLGVSVGGNTVQKATDEQIGDIPSGGYTVGAVSADDDRETTDESSASDDGVFKIGGVVATVFGAGYLIKRRLTSDRERR